MKKTIALLLAALMLIGGFALADGGFDTVPTDISGEVTFYTYYAENQMTHNDNAVAAMAEKYPNLKINIEHRADSDGTALRTWAAVGELPDYMEITNADTYETLLANGDLYKLNDALDATGFYDNYNNGELYAQSHSEPDGSKYSFGVGVSDIFVCYYHVSLFEELGLTEPTNYEEFKHCITVLKDAGKIPVALFAAEQWPGMSIYELACLAEGRYDGVDPINDGELKFANDEAYLRAAQKLQEIIEMGAFGTGALSTNASQAFELESSGEAGFVFNGSWHFNTGETDGFGDNLAWCHCNVFADADKAEEAKSHAVGGKITKPDFSVNAHPNSGLDPETLARLAIEFRYEVTRSEAMQGQRSLLKGDYEFVGSQYYSDFNASFGDYSSFTVIPYNLSNGQFQMDFGNAVEMMVAGDFTAEDFIEEMTACGF